MNKHLWSVSTFSIQPNPTSCIVILPGRGQNGNIGAIYEKSELDDALIVVIVPENLEWYPPPNGPQDQEHSIYGIVAARNSIEQTIRYIEKMYSIPTEKMVIIGHSAGGVMTLDLAANSSIPFAGFVSQSGIILDPSELTQSKNNSPILMLYNKDDNVFKLNERYLPTKEALRKRSYNVIFNESNHGGHSPRLDSFVLTFQFAGVLLSQQPDWSHSLIEKLSSECHQTLRQLELFRKFSP